MFLVFIIIFRIQNKKWKYYMHMLIAYIYIFNQFYRQFFDTFGFFFICESPQYILNIGNSELKFRNSFFLSTELYLKSPTRFGPFPGQFHGTFSSTARLRYQLVIFQGLLFGNLIGNIRVQIQLQFFLATELYSMCRIDKFKYY